MCISSLYTVQWDGGGNPRVILHRITSTHLISSNFNSSHFISPNLPLQQQQLQAPMQGNTMGQGMTHASTGPTGNTGGAPKRGRDGALKETAASRKIAAAAAAAAGL